MKSRIDSLLVEKGYFQTRQKAKHAIEHKCVYVENKLVEKSSKIIEKEAKITVQGEGLKFVSRGGLKLEKAVKSFDINLQEKICMDIGASTGGFTDCMLKKGAQKIYAVDVGHNQLVEKLKRNSKVINMEGTNIKNLEVGQFEKIDFISIDVSFISLTQVLDKVYLLLKDKGETVALIKPQFETGREALNKKGIVKDRKAQIKAIEKIILYARSIGFDVHGLDYSPIKGGNGNIEYLLYLRKYQSGIETSQKEIRQVVEMAYKELNKKEEAI